MPRTVNGTGQSVHLKLAAAAPISFVSVVVRSPSGIASDPQGGPHGPLSPLAGEDAAPEAALVVLSLTKFDVSHLSADNSVQHVPPHRIWEEPSLSRGLGWSWPALRTHTSHGAATLEDHDTAAALDGCRRENGARVRERAA